MIFYSENQFGEGKKLRTGLSTGSCASACARAAALFFLGEQKDKVEIWLPCGQRREVPVSVSSAPGYIEALTIKDAGDDPDITNGIEIGARMWLQKKGERIVIQGGEGVGKVTKPGLAAKVGEWAINPVPRQQITTNLKEVLPAHFTVRIEVFIPQGREIAKHTCNPLLGVEDGLSILGTTGLVLPMSHQAFRETVYLHIKQCVMMNKKTLCLVPGNYGYAKALELGFAEEEIVKISDSVGFALEACQELGAKKIILLGQVGKMLKVAGGIFDTHHSIADARREILFAHLVKAGLPHSFWDKVWEANTSEEVVLLISQWEGSPSFWFQLARSISYKAQERVRGVLEVESIIFSLYSGVLGRG